jgi:tRNA(fMet)-specific endonuclease VapC
MTEYILDTDTCIYWLKGKQEIRRNVEHVGADHLKTTVITLAELRYGAYYSQQVKENLKTIDNFVRKVQVIPLNEESADLFGKIKTDLRRSGQIVEDFDILIACITITYGGILVTNNVNHFKKIGGLNYESWLEQ